MNVIKSVYFCHSRRLLKKQDILLPLTLSSSLNRINDYLQHKHYNNPSILPSYTSLSHDRKREFSSSVAATHANPKRKIQPFNLTDIGEGIFEVELLKWYVEPNSEIKQFDKVCEVQSDKATVEITSRYDGIVHDLNNHNEGDMIQVGQPLMHISVEGDSDEFDSISSEKHDHEQTQFSSLSSVKSNSINEFESTKAQGKKVLATPSVRKLGQDHNLDLCTIEGSGPNGRVLREDIMKVLSSKNKEDKIHSISDDEEAIVWSTPIENGKVIPIRGYHRLMVNSMTTTLQVPHMTYSDEVEMTSLIKCRHDLNNVLSNSRKDLPKVSYLPFFIKACSLALKEYPILNSSIDVTEMNIIQHSSHDIGVAMDSERGLVVPVIRNCQSLSIMEIALELSRLRTLAETSALTEKDLLHPTFTLSNIGSIGGTIMHPVILPPQVAIGAMGKIQRLPRFEHNNSMDVKESHIMNMSWAGDHRVIDGATLGRFSNMWKSYIESPMTMAFAMK